MKHNIVLSERRLRYFLETMLAGSLRGAADRLEVEPSVISRQIQLLERDLGIKLLERKGRGVVPTEAAGYVVDHCRERQNSESSLLTKLAELNGLQRGEIHIVAGEGFVDDLVHWVLSEFCRQYPRLKISLEFVSAANAVRMIAQDQAHIGLAYNPPSDPAIHVIKSRTQPMCVVTPPDHPLTKHQGSLNLCDVLPFPVGMLSGGFGVTDLLRMAQYSERMELAPSFTTNSISTLKIYVKAGLGLTFLSANAIAPEIASKQLVALRTENPVMENAKAQLFVRGDRQMSISVSSLLSLLQSTNAFGFK